MELARCQQLPLATKMAVSFCDPQSSWQRGANEYFNGLLRQHVSYGSDLRAMSQSARDRTARELNQRSRKTRGFLTPVDALLYFDLFTG